MKHLLTRPVFATLLALSTVGFLPMSSTAAYAQATTSGTVVGTVTDPQGAMIPGATVTLTESSSKTTRTTTSNDGGQYILPDVPPGVYTVVVTKTGFSEVKINALTVSVGTQSTANAKLAIGAENTVISVEASNADLQTISATTGNTVEPVMVESLPAIGRDVASFLTMQPGVTPGGMTAGTTADQTSFQLDGGSNSSDMDGTQTGYTGANTNSTTGGFISAGPGGVVPMPQDSIEEFKVNTTGQTADFNNSSGSQSQIVTKRGRDRWTGTAYEYYLDNNFNGNTWQNNFPNQTFTSTASNPCPSGTATCSTAYTSKPSYHYSRFGFAAGGPILPKLAGGKTYLFANWEGFRYPLAATYERTVPSYQYLQSQQLTFTGVSTTTAASQFNGCTYTATTSTAVCSQAQLLAADPRSKGMPTTIYNFYNKQLPVAPSTNSGNVGNDGTKYAGTFDTSCALLSSTYCDGVNIIGYQANIAIPQKSNFFVARVDHDFGPKWHINSSYRYYNLQNTTSNQVDIGGVLAGDTIGTPKALTPRPQQPWFLVIGVTTNISPSLTNDFHYSYLRNFWQWKGAGAPAQVTGATGAIEPFGESSTTTVLAPYNVNAQNIRTRIWDGKDNYLTDNVSKLKGDHFVQMGGSFQHNWNYHQRTDNGASINYTPTFQLGDAGGGGNVTYTNTANVGLGAVGANASTKYARWLDAYYGIVTDTQVANTYSNVNGLLTLNPSYTPIGAKSTIPYYNLYATDTWHAKPSLTINYGLSWALEMPPSEANGNQVMWTDISGVPIATDQWLITRQNAALSGNVYNPEIGFALKGNAQGAPKYLYNPYYKAFSPRISAAWNPKFENAALKKIFGDGSTVIRGGYGRIYGRINGDVEVLNPLLSPGLILGTRCQSLQLSNTCVQSGYTDATAYRFGVDGVSPITAAAPPPTTLPQPYHPGFDGPGVSIASPVDPSLRPNDVDTFNLSIQRQINRKMMVEVGYIGRLIHHEYIMKNPNAVPYMTSFGGQSFAQAYVALEQLLGCTTSESLCQNSTAPTTGVTPQPFFEAALGGASSTYCTGYSSCTQAVLSKQLSKFRSQSVFSLWQALDNNVNGASGAGFVFGRSLMGTTTSNATYGGAGQVTTGISIGTADGYSNYHGGYVSFKISNWHGLTAQENLTYSKALGLGAYNQSTSSITAEDSWNLKQQYGVQGFDQRIIFNTFLVWQTPWYKDQAGIIGRLAGGWTISPVIAAGTGQPLTCGTNNSGQNFGGEDGSTFTDSESCIFTSPVSTSVHTHRGITGSKDPYNVAVGNAYHAGTNSSSAVNIFTNPAASYDSARPPILGFDSRDGGAGAIPGLPYLNMDLSIRKNLMVYERGSIELSGTLFNVMNHLDFANPSLALNSSTSWGVTKSQGNLPRQIQMGVRASW